MVAEPNRPDSDAGVRTAASSIPFAALATFAKPIVTMPAARPALARPVVTVNLNQSVAQAIRHVTHRRGRSTCNRCDRCKECCRAQYLGRSSHYLSPWGESDAETTLLPIRFALNKPSALYSVPCVALCCCEPWRHGHREEFLFTLNARR